MGDKVKVTGSYAAAQGAAWANVESIEIDVSDSGSPVSALFRDGLGTGRGRGTGKPRRVHRECANQTETQTPDPGRLLKAGVHWLVPGRTVCVYSQLRCPQRGQASEVCARRVISAIRERGKRTSNHPGEILP